MTTIVTYVDDIDGSTESVKNVRFSVDGHHHEIDLSQTHTEGLRETLRSLIAAGQRATASMGTPMWIGLEGQLQEVDLSVHHRRELLRLLRWYARRARVVATGADDPNLGSSSARSRPRACSGRPQDVRLVLVDVVDCEDLSAEDRRRLGGEMQVQARVISALSEQRAALRG